ENFFRSSTVNVPSSRYRSSSGLTSSVGSSSTTAAGLPLAAAAAALAFASATICSTSPFLNQSVSRKPAPPPPLPEPPPPARPPPLSPGSARRELLLRTSSSWRRLHL